jgi:hypothetical protein
VLVVSENLVGGTLVQNRKRRALLRDLVENIGQTPLGLPAWQAAQAFLERARDGLGQALAGPPRKLARQPVGFLVFDAESDVALPVLDIVLEYRSCSRNRQGRLRR